jgi:hypothetical protein
LRSRELLDVYWRVPAQTRTDEPFPGYFIFRSVCSRPSEQDGKKLFVVGRTYRSELERGESKSGQLGPFFSGISADDVAWAYVSYPESILWRKAGR